ncbi:similar to Saccharomyces cerevisiae YHR110W ERP5 Protein with similarity to Emp24p and Erv25p, member of the p24 family involved in ER to Golgi transport [Maudiozyma barnettii]|uniref:Similar to Saccharomyces cerevisiae YHR110W ERP5 Protein with similarity to Emp24p and Erv25p, member of the p24 family involved in ER to Golgi transport n=1 Tax=Maudiozyma barnettii TaxID=61262 RepID=A0A8H2VB71_9SACH|nr:Erp5p [Kazachstania barnettii]CAB4252027.1 similar to Saccharomyces cerevisiae YHR110W ERP5 Protein with similarity to Emp24p and Erv25p, member of the p24 family involved in ER to Golgi transport [Kazachstania barnettii]CAD1778471.1 similar to Saccharomyces cerevisiae YHR110W ERP5 Protein with similarity to Emp24p and Erv25p, member of the p24 family involved in ER to Golgi transport [Kazachstania barnettii]
MKVQVLTLISAVMALICPIQAMHIYLKPEETKCYYEHLTANSLLIGDLDAFVERNGAFVEDSGIKVKVTIDETFDNNQRVLNQKNSNSGDFSFTALETGEHRICLTPSYSDASANIRVFVDFEISHVHSLDSKRKDDVESLKSRVLQLTQRLDAIKGVQGDIRDNEAKFRNQSESANSKIMFWSVLQVIALGCTCAFQLNYLKNFFVKQKVV